MVRTCTVCATAKQRMLAPLLIIHCNQLRLRRTPVHIPPVLMRGLYPHLEEEIHA